MKKWFVMVLAVAMCVQLMACSSDEEVVETESSNLTEDTFETQLIDGTDLPSIDMEESTEGLEGDMMERTEGEFLEGDMMERTEGEFLEGDMMERTEGEFLEGDMMERTEGEFLEGDMMERTEGEFLEGDMMGGMASGQGGGR